MPRHRDVRESVLNVLLDFEALGVDLVVLDQAIDTTTPAGRLLFHVLAAIGEFERDLIRDRVLARLKRAKAQGVRLGRPRTAVDALRAGAILAEGRSLRQARRSMCPWPRWRARCQKPPGGAPA